MGISRSTYYDAPVSAPDDTAIAETIAAICDEFEHYGWRRVQAALRQQGMIVNHKKIKRLMREHGLQPRRRRRYVATTDSNHDQPIFPNRAKDMIVDRPNQLWISDITYVAITTGFVYVAVVLDAWSRRVVGYAIGRSIDVRLTLTALKVAIQRRNPPPGCVHHSDRGSIHQRAVPEAAGRSRRRLFDEPLRQCLGQCSDGELLLFAEDRTYSRQNVSNA
jgi:putative transposase